MIYKYLISFITVILILASGCGEIFNPTKSDTSEESTSEESEETSSQVATSNKGDTGERGAKGDKGDQGLPGIQGEKGDSGRDAENLWNMDLVWQKGYPDNITPINLGKVVSIDNNIVTIKRSLVGNSEVTDYFITLSLTASSTTLYAGGYTAYFIYASSDCSGTPYFYSGHTYSIPYTFKLFKLSNKLIIPQELYSTAFSGQSNKSYDNCISHETTFSAKAYTFVEIQDQDISEFLSSTVPFDHLLFTQSE